MTEQVDLGTAVASLAEGLEVVGRGGYQAVAQDQDRAVVMVCHLPLDNPKTGHRTRLTGQNRTMRVRLHLIPRSHLRTDTTMHLHRRSTGTIGWNKLGRSSRCVSHSQI